MSEGSLLNNIGMIINDFISNYNQKLSEKYNLNISELDSLWNEISCSTVQTNTQPQIQARKTTVDKKVESKVDEKSCPYTFTRGPNSGTVCGGKVKGDATYCTRHKQYEGKELKQKKVLPQPKKNESSEDEKKVQNEIKKKVFEGYTDIEINHMFFKKPELGEGLLYHKQTKLVCDHTKMIVGKMDGTRVLPLTEEDIKVAKSWNFKIKTVENQVPEKKIIKKIISEALNETTQEGKQESKQETITEKKPTTQESKQTEKTPQSTTIQESKQTPQSTTIQESKQTPQLTIQKESKQVEKKLITTQESKQNTSVQKKINIPTPQLNVKNIEKTKLQISESKTNSLNEQAKNTKKSITNLIEQQKQQKDIEEILEHLTNGSSSEEELEDENNESELDDDIDPGYDEE